MGEVERLEREKAENLRKWERRQIKRIIREAARQRRIRESFCIYAKEEIHRRLISKLKWKRIRVYFKAEAKRILLIRIELMKKMRRVRAAFKEYAWEQRSRDLMDAEEAYMREYIEQQDSYNLNQAMIKEEEYLRNTYKELIKMEYNERMKMADAEREIRTYMEEFKKQEQEKESETLQAMRWEEKEMRAFLAEELKLEQENEARINNEMVIEEAYLRDAYQGLKDMESKEREHMALDEWQQREGRKILREAMRKELLRESKRVICRRKARKMYIWSMFVLKARLAKMAYFARRASMRTAILRHGRKGKLAKYYQKRRVLVGIVAKARGILKKKADRLQNRMDKQNQKLELKTMAQDDFESMIYEVSTRKIAEHAKLKEEKRARKQYRYQIRESRRRNAITKLSANDQMKLRRIVDDRNVQGGYFDDDSSNTSSSYYGSDSNSDESDIVKSKDGNIVEGNGKKRNVKNRKAAIDIREEAQAEITALGLNFQTSTFSDSSEFTESDVDEVESKRDNFTVNWSSGSLSSTDSSLGSNDSEDSSLFLRSKQSTSSSDSSILNFEFSSNSDNDNSSDINSSSSSTTGSSSSSKSGSSSSSSSSSAG